MDVGDQHNSHHLRLQRTRLEVVVGKGSNKELRERLYQSVDTKKNVLTVISLHEHPIYRDVVPQMTSRIIASTLSALNFFILCLTTDELTCLIYIGWCVVAYSIEFRISS